MASYCVAVGLILFMIDLVFLYRTKQTRVEVIESWLLKGESSPLIRIVKERRQLPQPFNLTANGANIGTD